MPEHTQFSLAQFSLRIGLYRLIDAEILMVSGQNLHRPTVGVIEEDKVFKQIQKVFLFADAPQHRRQRYTAGILFFEALPFMEKFILAAQSADLRLHSIGEHQKGIVMEQERYGVQIIGVIIRIGIFHVHIVAFQFNEQERQTVHETDDICTTPVQVAVDFQLLYSEEMVIVRDIKINDSGPLLFRSAIGFLHLHRDPIPDQEILLFIDLQKRRGRQIRGKRLTGFGDLSIRDPRIELLQSLSEIAPEDNLMIALSSKGPVLAQDLGIIRINKVPAQLVMQQSSRAVLNQYIFRILILHRGFPPMIYSTPLPGHTSISPDISLGSSRSRASVAANT